MPGFAGLVQIGNTIDNVVVYRNFSTGAPVDSTSLPIYRIYGPSGLVASVDQFGVPLHLTFKDSLAITGATNASPSVITSVGHGLTTGTVVSISGVVGATGLNGGPYTATVIDTNTFSVGVNTPGVFVNSGTPTWHATGVYDFLFTPTFAGNFEPSTIYTVVVYDAAGGIVIDFFNFEVT